MFSRETLEKYLIGDYPKNALRENSFIKNTLSRNTTKCTLTQFQLN